MSISISTTITFSMRNNIIIINVSKSTRLIDVLV
jgi:hypothetical protein